MGKEKNLNLSPKKILSKSALTSPLGIQRKCGSKNLRSVAAQKLEDKHSTSLVEIMYHIRRQQHQKSIQATAPARTNEPSEPIVVLPINSNGTLKIEEYTTLQRGDLTKGTYNFSPYAMVRVPPSRFYQSRWYAESSKDTSANTSIHSSDLSVEDVAHIQADAKLKSWGWGGSGMHLSLQKQEMYNLIKGMGSTFAWSTILYDLALR